jgi:hypothetical protein
VWPVFFVVVLPLWLIQDYMGSPVYSKHTVGLRMPSVQVTLVDNIDNHLRLNRLHTGYETLNVRYVVH